VAAADLNLARTIALETDDMLLKAKAAVVAFAQMPVIIQADTPGMAQAFAAGSAARQDINLFYRLSDQGIMLYHYPASPSSTVGQDFSFRDYFQAAQQQNGHVFSKGRISPTTGRPVVTSVMPVFNQNRFDGVVATNLELQRLTETIRRVGLERAQDGGAKIIIIDAAGQVIAHSESDQLLEKLTETLPPAGAVLAGTEDSLTITDPQGAEWLLSYAPVPSAGWGVIVQRPSQLAFASLDTFQRGLLLALAIFSLGALFFWVTLSHLVITPLQKLTRYGKNAARRWPETEPDRRPIEAIAQRGDQIGHLTRTLLQAEDEVRARLLELTTLNKTSAAVVSTLDTQQVINKILDEVQQLLSVDQCALLALDEESQKLTVQASRSLSDHYPRTIDLRTTPAHHPALQAITTNQPVQVPDIEQGEDLLGKISLGRSEGYRSGLIVPLHAPHISPAALAVYRTDVHQFSPQEIELLSNFANQAALALEHATLFSLTDAELQRQVRFLSALNRVGHTVSQSLVVEDVLQNAMDTVFEVMPADACWIYLQRETENFLRLRAQRGLPDSLLVQIRDQQVEHGQGLTGWVVAQQQPLLLAEAETQAEPWGEDPLTTCRTWSSLAVVPLLAQETPMGALGLAAGAGQRLSQAELDLLEAIGAQITIAVINARLYRRSREMAILEERNRMAREIHDTLAQGFTGILIQLQAAERLSLKKPEGALRSLREARELARSSLQEARRSVFNLRPTVLENMTLDQAIAEQLHRLKIESGLETDFILEGYPLPLSGSIEQNLYRIAQEALTNVRRHAQARRVGVTLTYQPHSVSLTVTDDGRGLNGQPGQSLPAVVGLQPGKAGHFGLIGIQERVKLMGGMVTFEQPAGGGTTIKVVIPK